MQLPVSFKMSIVLQCFLRAITFHSAYVNCYRVYLVVIIPPTSSSSYITFLSYLLFLTCYNNHFQGSSLNRQIKQTAHYTLSEIPCKKILEGTKKCYLLKLRSQAFEADCRIKECVLSLLSEAAICACIIRECACSKTQQACV